MKRKNLLTATAITFALALTVWTIGATVNLSTIGFNVSSGDVVSASDFNNAFATVDSNFADVEGAINANRSGLANSHTSTGTGLSTTVQEVASVTIEAPGPGVIDVRAHAFFEIDHVQGGGDDIPRAFLTDTSASRNFDNLAIYTVESDQPSGFEYYSTFSIALVDEVASAGTYTYYLNGDAGLESQPGASEIDNPQLIATFHPASHGTVTATSANVGTTESSPGTNMSEPGN